MKWSYGIITVKERFDALLPDTITSLGKAGFTDPRIFIDDRNPATTVPGSLPQVCRGERIKTVGNWIMAAWELYLRKPEADRYAIFEDDLIAYPNLKSYLEACQYPEKGYWNLYTWNHNILPGKQGWYLSDQMGKGAVGLVFSNDVLRTLLANPVLVNRPLDVKRRYKGVDGMIVNAMNSVGHCEYVHNPTLLQHVGVASVMGNRQHPQANSFRGEGFDAMRLLEEQHASAAS